MSSQREILSRNLKKLIDSKGIDQKILADYLGTSEMSVSNWVNGNKYPRIGNIQKMADYFGVKKSELIEDNEEKPVFTSSEYYYLPTTISAGLPLDVEAITSADKIAIPDTMMGKWAGKRDIFITKINGDSMDKILPDGSLIAVKPITMDCLKNGDIVVFSNSDYDYSVKYFHKTDEKLIFKPASHNTDHYEQHYNINDNVTIHGKVVMYLVELD